MSPKAKNTKKLVLLDAHAIIHRAYHALPDFLSRDGEPTGALYGLSNMLMKIIAELKPDYIVACYDLPGKTFRHEAYDNYKAGRVEADDALIEQLNRSRDIFEAFDISIYDEPGFEADDMLGTITDQVKKKYKDVSIVIASGDMDTLQLVDKERVQVYTLKRGINDTILYSEEKVLERFGFGPKLLPDYKGLRGDPSDNIIGIKGIGEKTATNLITSFGSLEDIYKKLKKGEKEFKYIGLTDRIIGLLKEGEEEAMFSKTLAKIRHDAPIEFVLDNKTFWQKVDPSKIEELFRELDFKSLLSRLKKFFADTGGASLMGGFDFSADKEEGFKAEDEVDQRQLLEASIGLWLLDSDNTTPGLEDIFEYTRTKDFQKAYETIFEDLKKENLEKVYSEIEEPIIDSVLKMSEVGILIDQDHFKKLSSDYHKELNKISKKIFKLADTEFNINSPKQLGEVLFEKMGIKSKKKTSSGALSTKAEVLEALAPENPIVEEVLRYRELQKLLSTYIDVIPNMVGDDGRLHAKFLQHGTATGRFSSQDPNLQNLPIKSESGRKIRAGFVARSGYKLVALDYSQIELRVVAILSGDEKMTQIFKEGKDIHSGVASFVFGVPIDKVTKEMRRQAKVINFGIIYGMGVNALRKNLGGTRAEAQNFYNNYFKQFSGVKKYLDGVKEFASKEGYTETLFGRRRYFPNIRSRIPFLRAMAERTAINAPVQGTATADVIKLAIRFAKEDLKKAKLDSKVDLLMQVHDELVYEIKNDVVEDAVKIIQKAMEGVLARSFIKYKTDIPLLVEYGVGKNLKGIK